MPTNTQESFINKVARLRSGWTQTRQSSNLFPPAGKPVIDIHSGVGDKPFMILWYEDGIEKDGTEKEQCVRLFDIPGTLSGDILRLQRNLPEINGHFEIDGDIVRHLDHNLESHQSVQDDFENLNNLLKQLPVLQVDVNKLFLKKGKYRSEIENLLKCQGGSAPGEPKSRHVIQLLGRTANGELVFDEFLPCHAVIPRSSSLATSRLWILDLIDALSFLHSLGIIHRDVRIDNCLFSQDATRLILCDLESRWGQRTPPEISSEGELDDAGWSSNQTFIASVIASNAWSTPTTLLLVM